MGHQENFILDQRDALSIVISVVLVVLVVLCCIFHVKMKCCQTWVFVAIILYYNLIRFWIVQITG